jgi:RNA polymerase sigma-70 factor (ECF subfamily)
MAAAEPVPAAATFRVDIAARQRLESMYCAHHQVIWRTLRRLGFSPEAAADSTHQAFVIAAERLNDIRAGSEKAFLFSTAIRQAKTVRRKNNRLELNGEIEAGPDPSVSETSTTNRQVALQLLERVLSRMDEELVTVFSLFELEGLSSPEIAELIGIPWGTVASRLRRAREVFRAAAERLETQVRTRTPIDSGEIHHD